MKKVSIPDDLHVLDIVTEVAQKKNWAYDRRTVDEMAVVLEGQWRKYSLTFEWSQRDDSLLLICNFEMEPPTDQMAALNSLLNKVNDIIKMGTFTYWGEEKLMVWRYKLLLSGVEAVHPQQVEDMLDKTLAEVECYYPAFQLVGWGGNTPEAALKLAIAVGYGHA